MRRFLWLAIVVLLFAADANAQSRQPPQQPRPQDQRAAEDQRGTAEQPLVVHVVPGEGDQTEAEKERRDHEREAVNEGRMVFLTLALAVFAGVQAFFTFVTTRGLKYARRSAEAAERNIETLQNIAKAQLRAYVGIENVKISNTKGAGPAVVSVVIKNSGQTPAYKVATHFSVRWGARNEIDLAPLMQPGGSSDFMSPGDQRETEMEIPRKLLEQILERIDSGTMQLFALGLIEYDDAFGDKRTTTFRAVAERPLRDGALALDTEGNEAT